MEKLIVHANNLEKERDIFFVKEDRNYLRKHAAAKHYHPKITEYVDKAKPLPDLIQILLTALGAFEFWGQNNNGDRFRQVPLSNPGEDYGYNTFVTNANYFTHHVNQNPALAKGKVLHAVWNDDAKRVELVIGINPKLDPEASEAIDRGDSLAFSMGCKTPYDVCSICLNKAKTRAEYCDHARYMMNQIDSATGKLVGVDNPFPRFFDISRVLIPADKTAYMWEKVASPANPFAKLSSAELAELPPGKLNDVPYLLKKIAENEELSKLAGSKKASVKKKAEMTKRVEVTMPKATTDRLDQIVPPAQAALLAMEPTISTAHLEKIKELAPTIEHLLSTILILGIRPKEEELAEIAPKDLRPLGSHLYDGSVAQALLPYIPERSYARPHLARRMIMLADKVEENPDVIKKASAMRLERPGPAPQVTPFMLAGMAAALYSLLGKNFISNHPLLTLALGATGLAGMNSLRGQTDMGYFDVASGPGSAYNRSWQSSLLHEQARPVTVVKTGASKIDTSLAKKVFYGVPAIFMGSHLAKSKEESGARTGSVTHFVAHNPDVLAGGLIAEHYMGKPISKTVSQALEGGKRLFKHASLRDIDFLSNLPEEEQPLFWDLAILDAAQRIQKKLGG